MRATGRVRAPRTTSQRPHLQPHKALSLSSLHRGEDAPASPDVTGWPQHQPRGHRRHAGRRLAGVLAGRRHEAAASRACWTDAAAARACIGGRGCLRARGRAGRRARWKQRAGVLAACWPPGATRWTQPRTCTAAAACMRAGLLGSAPCAYAAAACWPPAHLQCQRLPDVHAQKVFDENVAYGERK